MIEIAPRRLYRFAGAFPGSADGAKAEGEITVYGPFWKIEAQMTFGDQHACMSLWLLAQAAER